MDDALALLALPGAASGPRLYWSAHDRDEAIAGLGCAQEVALQGEDRFARASAACRAGRQDLAPSDSPDVRWLGGFAFEPAVDPTGPWAGLPALWLVLPRISLVVSGGKGRLVLSDEGDPAALAREARVLADRLAAASVPPPAAALDAVGDGRTWDRLIGAAADERLARRLSTARSAVRDGRLDKVVIATHRTLRLDRPPDPVACLAALRLAEPHAYHFLLSPRPGLAFLGASPERLVRVEGDRAWTTALAGSARRGTDAAEDAALGDALQRSPKERAEHDHVVAAVRGTLEAAGHHVVGPEGPELRKLRRVQHLETPMQVRLDGRGDVLLEAGRLHPTPALGGWPRAPALRALADIEGAPRGWYGGGVGEVHGTGDGEIAVAIRSFLLRGDSVTAYAGAGVVADSDPAAEVAEIRLKLAATLAPFLA